MGRLRKPEAWRVGTTSGGALGIWSGGCRADNPDVCLVAAVPDARDEVNARLIAAAPALLAACRALIDAPHHDHFATRLGDEEMDAVNAIRDAIERAEES